MFLRGILSHYDVMYFQLQTHTEETTASMDSIDGISQSTTYTDTSESPKTPSIKSAYTPDPAGRQRARKVDEVSRIAFPVCFILFNILYWFVYKYSLWGLVKFV